jgi:hypothetical protein
MKSPMSSSRARILGPGRALLVAFLVASPASAQSGLLAARAFAEAAARAPAGDSSAAPAAAEHVFDAFASLVERERRLRAARRLTSADATDFDALVAAGRSAALELDGGTTRHRLERVLSGAQADGLVDRDAALRALAPALERFADDLAFEPRMEAELPPGFPPPTPAYEIELLSYPAYRLASADMARGDGRAFWTLFEHIESNDIPMTAPVETTYSEEDARRPATMAFLYDEASRGEVGERGAVTIADVAPQLVVSIGCRGNDTPARIASARSALESWIAERSDLEVAGPLRVMGFNSPMVIGSRRFFEVQIPVRARSGGASGISGVGDAPEKAGAPR